MLASAQVLASSLLIEVCSCRGSSCSSAARGLRAAQLLTEGWAYAFKISDVLMEVPGIAGGKKIFLLAAGVVIWLREKTNPGAIGLPLSSTCK